ncbi:hypothetical protein [Embleya scabrispora]|uniref:hypothetical protein n=1 Tax=Embleya scabrispora TaxID=159449 RepID=UPI00037CC6FD|nr:hypothetical protein [Embleya scabrispora]MYS80799.1 hypothetical protein [Streptomyces sp. SID5474]
MIRFTAIAEDPELKRPLTIRPWDHGITITADEQFVWAGDADIGCRGPVLTMPEPVAP